MQSVDSDTVRKQFCFLCTLELNDPILVFFSHTARERARAERVQRATAVTVELEGLAEPASVQHEDEMSEMNISFQKKKDAFKIDYDFFMKRDVVKATTSYMTLFFRNYAVW